MQETQQQQDDKMEKKMHVGVFLGVKNEWSSGRWWNKKDYKNGMGKKQKYDNTEGVFFGVVVVKSRKR